jgi:hypothetical protein
MFNLNILQLEVVGPEGLEPPAKAL